MSAVKKTDDATAGSSPSFSSSTGTKAPAKPATTRLPHIATITTSPSKMLPSIR